MKKYASRVQPLETGLYDRLLRAVAWRASLAISLAIATSCAQQAQPPPDNAFDAVKRDEARMARGFAMVDSAQTCGAAQSGADVVCDARRDLCARSRDNHDRDIQAHCLRGADNCASARMRADMSCANPDRRAGP